MPSPSPRPTRPSPTPAEPAVAEPDSPPEPRRGRPRARRSEPRRPSTKVGFFARLFGRRRKVEAVVEAEPVAVEPDPEPAPVAVEPDPEPAPVAVSRTPSLRRSRGAGPRAARRSRGAGPRARARSREPEPEPEPAPEAAEPVASEPEPVPAPLDAERAEAILTGRARRPRVGAPPAVLAHLAPAPARGRASREGSRRGSLRPLLRGRVRLGAPSVRLSQHLVERREGVGSIDQDYPGYASPPLWPGEPTPLAGRAHPPAASLDDAVEGYPGADGSRAAGQAASTSSYRRSACVGQQRATGRRVAAPARRELRAHGVDALARRIEARRGRYRVQVAGASEGADHQHHHGWLQGHVPPNGPPPTSFRTPRALVGARTPAARSRSRRPARRSGRTPRRSPGAPRAPSPAPG